MTFYRVGYEKYNVTARICNKNILVATIRTPLIGLDTIYISMHFPYQDQSEIKLNSVCLDESEIIEKAKHIIMKKLYRMQNDILQDIKVVDFDNEKYIGNYMIRDTFTHGNVYTIE